MCPASASLEASRAQTESGVVEGLAATPSGVRAFLGLPFAAPPVGELRWRPPEPARPWSGVREAKAFGPRPMQMAVFGDMDFRSSEMSEDCLTLNVWTPARSAEERLPVLVYFYGGGFVAGDGSEPRYDGASLAAKGIVFVTANYRLGLFGFLAHAGLSAESAHGASGNYGLLDQVAALEWVKRNIAAFGGDPDRITIGGESAGSYSVSALMASPLSKHLIAGVIGESGSIAGPRALMTRAEAEAAGATLLGAAGIKTVAEARARPAEELLNLAGGLGSPSLRPILDGYFLTTHPRAIFEAGEQAHVPVLAGVNSQELPYTALLGPNTAPTLANYRAAVEKAYGADAEAVLRVYPATTDGDEVMDAALALASDRFIGHSTWIWIDLSTKTGAAPTYWYLYAQPRPPMRPEMAGAVAGLAGGVTRDAPPAERPPPDRGAVHSAEIEYALGNLATNTIYDWTEADYRVSALMESYFANFVKSGDPNGEGLPEWPRYAQGKRLVIDTSPHAIDDDTRARYETLDRLTATL